MMASRKPLKITDLGVLVAVCLAAFPSMVGAQVMEIGADGAVKVFSGPAVITEDGVTPILSPPTKRRRIPRRSVPIGTAGETRSLARAAEAAELSPDLMAAVAWRESGFRTDVVSRAGAVGEMQLMPATARALGVDPTDAQQNLKGGASYLNALMRRYDGDLVRTLAAYNAGPAAVDRFHGVPPYKETQAYVAAVLDRLSQAVIPPAPRSAR